MNKGLTKGNGFEKGLLILITAMSFWLGSVASGYAAPMLQFNASQLTGATGVDVGGTLYDLTLMDGTCVDLFGGCDELSDFPFPDTPATQNAYTAFGTLLSAEAFVYNSNNVVGCSLPLFCNIKTPAEFGGLGIVGGGITIIGVGHELSSFSATLDSDFSSGVSNVYGKWTVSQIGANPVPEPSTMLLLGSGIVGLIGYRMRKPRA